MSWIQNARCAAASVSTSCKPEHRRCAGKTKIWHIATIQGTTQTPYRTFGQMKRLCSTGPRELWDRPEAFICMLAKTDSERGETERAAYCLWGCPSQVSKQKGSIRCLYTFLSFFCLCFLALMSHDLSSFELVLKLFVSSKGYRLHRWGKAAHKAAFRCQLLSFSQREEPYYKQIASLGIPGICLSVADALLGILSGHGSATAKSGLRGC